MKLLYIVKNYPQLSQTYIKSEINTLLKDFEIHIVATSVPNTPDTECLSFQHVTEEEAIIEQVEKIKPDVIHSHYLLLAPLISSISKKTGVPFTIRAHSFDAIMNKKDNVIPSHITSLNKHLNHDLCKGVLIFPFTRELLVKEGGVDSDKLIDVPPVVDVNRFNNREANGDAIMNIGACIPKKAMEEFVKLSRLVPDKTFNLYALGHKINHLLNFNAEINGRVNFNRPVPYSLMPIEYKKHQTMVYTADLGMKTVGWPMAVIEAMASGTIVYMPNIRPDIKDFIGEAGYIYSEVEELTEVLKKPIDNNRRQYAFEYAQEFDIKRHISKLTNLW